MILGGQIISRAHSRSFAFVDAGRTRLKVVVEAGLIHEQRIALEIRAEHGIGLVGQRAWPDDDVVPDNHWCRDARADVDERSAVGTFVHDRIVDDEQFGAGVCRIGTFFLVRDDRRVVGVRSLLDQVADDVGQTSVWKVDFVAIGAVFARDAVVENPVFRSA